MQSVLQESMRELDEHDTAAAIEAAVMWESQVEFLKAQSKRERARRP